MLFQHFGSEKCSNAGHGAVGAREEFLRRLQLARDANGLRLAETLDHVRRFLMSAAYTGIVHVAAS